MLKILAGLTWKTCLVYLDDIIVFAKTFEEQIKNLEEVLHRLKQANLKLTKAKTINCQSPLPGKAKAVLGRSSGAIET
jgi:hypothetical protein